MAKQQILDKLICLVKKLCNKDGIDYDHINFETKLKEDLFFTSIDVLMIAIAIEKEFNVEITNMNPDFFQTVGSVVDKIFELENK